LPLTDGERYVSSTARPALQGPDEARALLTEEVNAVNINQTLNRQADFGMPASGRVRTISLRTLPVTTGVAVSSAAGEKCALVDVTLATGYSRVATDVAVITDAFPGTSAWSPPS
jgi:hypothetical protein